MWSARVLSEQTRQDTTELPRVRKPVKNGVAALNFEHPKADDGSQENFSTRRQTPPL